MNTRQTMNWHAKQVLILGLGASGLAAARWLIRRGAQVRVADQSAMPSALPALREAFPDIVVHLGAWQVEDLAWAQYIVVSPGVPLSHPLIQKTIATGKPVWSDVEVFAQALPDTARVIAITGSNGKSTVTTMVADMCEAAGLRTRMAGNIGIPVLEALDSHPDTEVFVLELSSFQLESVYSLRSAAATILNVSEDHLDRYPGLSAYAAAKARIYAGAEVQVINRDDAFGVQWAHSDRRQMSFGLSPAKNEDEFGLQAGDLCRGSQRLMPAADLRVAGQHNIANALAAWALCHVLGLPDAPLAQALRKFGGLAHRVEWVAKVAEVDFYDDSKGTNVGATVAALKGMKRPLVLIAGGEGKGQDFSPLAEAMGTCTGLVQIGRDGGLIAQAVARTGIPVLRAESMEEAVVLAYAQARPGDAVLLSPACASFDMFDNYAHRAQVFVAAVQHLVQEPVR
jgi:UDP-N-acetylmuramoylalanine--D-glutamate ligase